MRGFSLVHDPEGSRYKRRVLRTPSLPLRVTEWASLRAPSLPLRAGSGVAISCMGKGLPYVELSLYTYDR